MKWEGTNVNKISVNIGQYSDYISISDFNTVWKHCYCCGQNASWQGGKRPDGMTHSLCNACHFRHTVMKSAGREDEFWAKYKYPCPTPVSELAKEMSYRLAASIDAMILATG